MIALIGVMAVTNSTTDMDLSYNNLHNDEAFYVAEAGGHRAVSQLIEDKTWRDGYSDISFGNGVYSVVVADSTTDSTLADTVVVTSTGIVEGAMTNLQFEVAPKIYNPFKYAMFGDELVDIRNSMHIDSYNSDSGTYWSTRLDADGDVGSNVDVVVANGGFVGGDVQSATLGGIDIHPGATVTGDTSDTAEEQELPPIPQAAFDSALANMNLDSISGSFTYDSVTHDFSSEGTVTLGSGVYYFSTITLFNSANLVLSPGAEVTVYVTGDIEMKNSATVNDGGDPGDLIFYSQGDFVLKNSGDIRAVFYSPDGSADLRNSGEFYGSIVANDIVNHNSANFHYDRTLADINIGGIGDYEVVAFIELL